MPAGPHLRVCLRLLGLLAALLCWCASTAGASVSWMVSRSLFLALRVSVAIGVALSGLITGLLVQNAYLHASMIALEAQLARAKQEVARLQDHRVLVDRWSLRWQALSAIATLIGALAAVVAAAAALANSFLLLAVALLWPVFVTVGMVGHKLGAYLLGLLALLLFMLFAGSSSTSARPSTGHPGHGLYALPPSRRQRRECWARSDTALPWAAAA